MKRFLVVLKQFSIVNMFLIFIFDIQSVSPHILPATLVVQVKQLICCVFDGLCFQKVPFQLNFAFSALTLLVWRQEGHLACKRMGGWWRWALLSPIVNLLILPCTIKSRSSLLAADDPGCPGKRAVKRWWWTFQRNDLWPQCLASWFTVTLSGSDSKVKGQSSLTELEKCCGSGRCDLE